MWHRGYARQDIVFKAAVLFCVLLVGFTLSVEAIHFHPDGNASNEKHCSMCSGAHFAMPVAQAHVTPEHPAATRDITAKRVAFVVRDLPFNLFDRPPPSI